MNFQVALIDKSEIVHKMISHCLYYFSVEVSRFEQWEECLSHFAHKKPDIVFVDWESKKGDERIIYLAQDKWNLCPVVLLYRLEHQAQTERLSKEQIPYRVKKPIQPKELRDTFIQLVPQVRESKIHRYLKFPKSEEEKKQEILAQTEGNKKPKIDQTLTKDTHTGYMLDKTKSFVGNLIKKTGLTERTKKSVITNQTNSVTPTDKTYLHTQTRLTGEKIKTQTHLTDKATKTQPTTQTHLTDKAVKTQPTTQTHLTDKAVKTQTHLTDKATKTQPTTQTHLTDKAIKTQPITQTHLTDKAIKTQVAHPNQGKADNMTGIQSPEVIDLENQPKNQTIELSQEKTKTKKVNKDDININEDTKNDLAPMAMKTSIMAQEESKTNTSRELSETDILKVISKYKDSLEFQELVEKILMDYAKKTVACILQGDKTKDILQQPLKEFKDSLKFKEIVEKESAKYIQKHLPLVMKQIVEQEIKKIIGN